MYYSKDEMEKLKDKANVVNLCDYLRTHGVELIPKGREFCTSEHDSLSISPEKNIWRQYSQVNPRTGKVLSGDAISYLQRFMHMTFLEATNELIKFGYGNSAVNEFDQTRIVKPSIEKKDKLKDPVKLPEKESGTWKQLFGYLCKSRCLDKEIVQECVNNKTIYLASGHHNAVFVRYDDNDIPRYATQRGTLTDKSFKCDCGSESDKSFGWLMKGNENSSLLYVFESPIDALSCATFEKKKGIDYHKNSKLSLGGLWDGALERYLKSNPKIHNICFCLDSDEPGNKAANQYLEKYKAKGFNVTRFEPNYGKDINDMLKHSVSRSENVTKQINAQMR